MKSDLCGSGLRVRCGLAGVALAVAFVVIPAGAQAQAPAQGVAMPALRQVQAPVDTAPATSEPATSAPLATSAEGCQTDLQSMQKKRIGIMEDLNKLMKRNKGKLDPVAACPKFRNLVAVETQFKNYMNKNKDWCNIPDQVIQTVTEASAKDAAVATQACNLAAQARKMRAQQAQGGPQGIGAPPPPRLPAGPL